ncbi:hypothetical protein QN277_004559 [Acacia crassicarpa]|uniref:long-chain-alcohol oxidase n=1 Tax=Acacia crassicarpa TaxID=499986 RepID=A0AAE1J2V5_9FABA|nr:hypothetical protein QN277_004559 [Acacia crassicarpa]
MEEKNMEIKRGSFRESISKEETVIELGNIDAHTLLAGGGAHDDDDEVYHQHLNHQTLTNSLSHRQMASLTALCDTFLPSAAAVGGDSDDAATFYWTLASTTPTPERLGGLICNRLRHPKTWILKLTLWLLSTWIGTVIVCGVESMSWVFPFFHSFPDLPLEKRQRIVQGWSLSYFSLLRMLFRTVKLLTLFVFFTQLDEAEDNASWKAIGYKGPDPEFRAQLKKQFLQAASKEHKDHVNQDTEHIMGPLYKGIVRLDYPRDITVDSLRRFGFPVSVTRRKSSSSSLVIHCDVVVVGSGSGGGVVAGVLAKAGYKVLVLEKGNYFSRNNLSLLEGPTMDQMYLSHGLIATDDMSALVLAGSTVGGGSAINWSACIKTPKHVCKEWCDEHELELFKSKLYEEAVNVVCEKMGVQSEVKEEGFNNAILRKGCEELGYPVSNIPRNSPPDHYCGWCCMGCKDGKKKSTSETWLVDLVKSGNGVILPGCEAVKVLHKNKKGTNRKISHGVEFEYEYKGSKEICVVESKVTIVACGALCTPSLLKKSGLKNPNIGKQLHLHPVAMAWGYFPDSSSSNVNNVWPEEEKKSYEGGIMTAMSTVNAEFEKSGYGVLIQAPSLHPGMFSILMPWVSGTDMKDRMRKFSRTAHIFALARDHGSGVVSSPTSISYKMKQVDERNLQKGIEKVLRILAAAGAEEIGTHHGGGRRLKVKEVSCHEFERFVKEESRRPLRDLSTPLCSAHQMGSCRMGRSPTESVVDEKGETWEVEGLYVADASVFPTALGVNPMVTVQAIAYCTAQSALEALRRKRCS